MIGHLKNLPRCGRNRSAGKCRCSGTLDSGWKGRGPTSMIGTLSCTDTARAAPTRSAIPTRPIRRSSALRERAVSGTSEGPAPAADLIRPAVTESKSEASPRTVSTGSERSGFPDSGKSRRSEPSGSRPSGRRPASAAGPTIPSRPRSPGGRGRPASRPRSACPTDRAGPPKPSGPAGPVRPRRPSSPARPSCPTGPTSPSNPASPAGPGRPASRSSQPVRRTRRRRRVPQARVGQ